MYIYIYIYIHAAEVVREGKRGGRGRGSGLTDTLRPSPESRPFGKEGGRGWLCEGRCVCVKEGEGPEQEGSVHARLDAHACVAHACPHTRADQ